MNNGILTSGYAPPQMPGGLLGGPTAVEMIDAYGYDADARRYIRAVEAADRQPLELAVRLAINEFVVGCKRDGIWPAIKASCILMGARTLAGALVPLAGPAPTNSNFVSGDYNRKTGLVGNNSTKRIDTNRAENADGLNDNHYAAYVSTVGTQGVLGSYGFGGTPSTSMSNAATRNRNTNPDLFTLTSGFVGMSRSASASYLRRNAGATTTLNTAAVVQNSGTVFVHDANGLFYGTHRIAFYSLGSSLTLATLDARVSSLYAAIAGIIP